ncbi:hypothetical protein NADFUDRAFT_50169 [Nadsonia fulvescens var. elongata DSM 6958]|uniref:Mediator of RNA polymerase II transcription subunit 21 n=1 Tax=Nadsonia fulvescens var. elongata DSM 6958 TaxID=857566 RepID=A0A1E3PLP5_9ASCO|nr:hypothetical protein NADFUDRAFT_50169 [Nadsonia fulvescens var. elongata DSM 6958]
MADRLTQLQTCLDQLVKQCYSSLSYINKNHDFKSVDPNLSIGAIAATANITLSDPNVVPVPREEFQRVQMELARDLVVKTQQIEILIDSLPGIGVSKQSQLERVKALEEELQMLDKVKAQEVANCNKIVGQVEGLVNVLTRIERGEMSQTSASEEDNDDFNDGTNENSLQDGDDQMDV